MIVALQIQFQLFWTLFDWRKQESEGKGKQIVQHFIQKGLHTFSPITNVFDCHDLSIFEDTYCQFIYAIPTKLTPDITQQKTANKGWNNAVLKLQIPSKILKGNGPQLPLCLYVLSTWFVYMIKPSARYVQFSQWLTEAVCQKNNVNTFLKLTSARQIRWMFSFSTNSGKQHLEFGCCT